jgi:hypothetical protein
VLIVALTAGSIAIIGARQSADEAPLTSADTSTEMMAAPGAAESRDQPAPPAEPTAPPYVALNGDVWELADSAAPAPTAPTAAGVVISSLSDGDGASEHPASFSGSDRSVLYVAAPDGSYRAFTRVIRTLGRAEYGLVSGGVISRFGRWPSLPSRFVEPESTDGSPEFRRFGFDDLGVDVYVPPAGRTQDGFAVAPGTAGDDPAAGNPGWTWWEPLP